MKKFLIITISVLFISACNRPDPIEPYGTFIIKNQSDETIVVSLELIDEGIEPAISKSILPNNSDTITHPSVMLESLDNVKAMRIYHSGDNQNGTLLYEQNPIDKDLWEIREQNVLDISYVVVNYINTFIFNDSYINN